MQKCAFDLMTFFFFFKFAEVDIFVKKLQSQTLGLNVVDLVSCAFCDISICFCHFLCEHIATYLFTSG